MEEVVGDVAGEHGVPGDGGSARHFVEHVAGGVAAAVAHVGGDGLVGFNHVSIGAVLTWTTPLVGGGGGGGGDGGDGVVVETAKMMMAFHHRVVGCDMNR